MEPELESSPPLSVLVVEAHNDTADSLAELLRLVGHRVAVARCGEAALEAVTASPPDVVLMEVRLPDLDGWQLAEQLMEAGSSGKRPFLVAVTTCGSERDCRRSAEVGIDLLLLKPVEPGLLLGLLRRFARVLAT